MQNPYVSDYFRKLRNPFGIMAYRELSFDLQWSIKFKKEFVESMLCLLTSQTYALKPTGTYCHIFNCDGACLILMRSFFLTAKICYDGADLVMLLQA